MGQLPAIFSFWWLIWKEHNRRIFEDKHISAYQLASLAQEETSALSVNSLVYSQLIFLLVLACPFFCSLFPGDHVC
jgi:hypothetical protein